MSERPTAERVNGIRHLVEVAHESPTFGQTIEPFREIDALTAQNQSLTEQLRHELEFGVAGHFGFMDWATGKSGREIAHEIDRRHKETERVLIDIWKEQRAHLESQLAQLTLERDQLREQCAYNQLTIEALTAKLAKADRMDQ